MTKAASQPGRPGRYLRRHAGETLTPIELDCGDTLLFTLRDGQTRRMTLLETAASPLVTNLAGGKTGRTPHIQGKTSYAFTCRIEIDGHPMTLQRYVGTQEGFCEPYVVNGMWIWLDAVADIFDFLTENHGACRPARRARFAVQDAAYPICPERVFSWYPNPGNFIDVNRCYGGDDPWMGAYAGEDAHGGLDVDMPDGTPLFAPISLQDQYLVRSVHRGDGNNRWEGKRTWKDGSTWLLNVSHVARLAVKEHTPLPGGRRIGDGAGMAVGYHNHSHFIFRVVERGESVDSAVFLDPWLLFREAFERARRASGELRAAMTPPLRGVTGAGMEFRCRLPSPRKTIAYYWTFGDGGFSADRNPVHVFARPGLYPVTLTVDDGRQRATATCHLTVDGTPVKTPVLRLASIEDVSFRTRPAWVADVHGIPPPVRPHTVKMMTMSDGTIELYPYLWKRPKQPMRRNPWRSPTACVSVLNSGRGRLKTPATPRITYETGDRGWLVATVKRLANSHAIVLAVRPRGRPGGIYRACVSVAVPGAINSPASFRVEMNLSARSPFWHAAVDDRDPECHATPYFWVAPALPAWWPRAGHAGRSLYNGRRSRAGEFVRFTPYLWGGLYDVELGPDTPCGTDTRVAVRIRHQGGIKTVIVNLQRSRRVGTFSFPYGTGGWIEIDAGRSRGQIAADLVYFVRVGDSPTRSWDLGISSAVRPRTKKGHRRSS